jgi:hypothetical protein
MRQNGIVTVAGKSYRVHAGNTSRPAIYARIPASTGWRRTPAHERRLKSTSPLFGKVLAEFQRLTNPDVNHDSELTPGNTSAIIAA